MTTGLRCIAGITEHGTFLYHPQQKGAAELRLRLRHFLNDYGTFSVMTFEGGPVSPSWSRARTRY
jgi:hypothetical protein